MIESHSEIMENTYVYSNHFMNSLHSGLEYISSLLRSIRMTRSLIVI